MGHTEVSGTQLRMHTSMVSCFLTRVSHIQMEEVQSLQQMLLGKWTSTHSRSWLVPYLTPYTKLT
ncbi:hypothetical protein I79_002630 [Cricetulus griseus]|uniref:Uncharacterized protein n=1 Tax=Cricetulus griseus TaxID=10029 RepID=G3GXY5_CRIGR|nr:hypothetical protein I79_002630 [Cricetulus griseus]